MLDFNIPPLVVSSAEGLDFTVLTIKNRRILFDLFNKRKINLKPFGFKKAKAHVRKVSSAKEAVSVLDSLTNQKHFITSFQDLKKTLPGFNKVQQPKVKKVRIYVHYEVIGPYHYLVIPARSGKTRLKKNKFKSTSIFYLPVQSRKQVLKTLDKLAENDITIFNLKTIQDKLGISGKSALEKMQKHASHLIKVIYPDLKKIVDLAVTRLAPKISRLYDAIKNTGGEDRVLVTKHNELVLSRNNLESLLETFLEQSQLVYDNALNGQINIVEAKERLKDAIDLIDEIEELAKEATKHSNY